MRLQIFTMAAMAATAMTATAAWAQDGGSSPTNWSGFYVGGQLGYSTDIKQSNKETVQFDRNLDGTFGDAFTNFSPASARARPLPAVR